MGNKISVLILLLGVSLAPDAFSDPTDPNAMLDLHNAIRNKDPRHASLVLFDEDLSIYPQIMTFSIDWYKANARDIDRILQKRNSEGESAISLLRDFPNVRVARVINYALAIASVHSLSPEDHEESPVEFER